MEYYSFHKSYTKYWNKHTSDHYSEFELTKRSHFQQTYSMLHLLGIRYFETMTLHQRGKTDQQGCPSGWMFLATTLQEETPPLPFCQDQVIMLPHSAVWKPVSVTKSSPSSAALKLQPYSGLKEVMIKIGTENPCCSTSVCGFNSMPVKKKKKILRKNNEKRLCCHNLLTS